MIKIAPSILSADFSRLGEDIREIERTGAANLIHVDVMDGVFVPNITIGPLVVEAIKRQTSLPLDVHLMIVEPHRYIEQFAEAGADYLTVHIEACPNVHRDIEMIRRAGVKTGVALNPGTPLSAVEEVLPDVDLVLIMTVDPGFGGQAFIAGQLPKIARARELVENRGFTAKIAVDGGISAATAPATVTAGARLLVAGSAVFRHPHGIIRGLSELRDSLVGVAKETS